MATEHEVTPIGLTAIFTNTFGQPPADAGFTQDGLVLRQGSHELALELRHGRILGWLLDGQPWLDHRLYGRADPAAAANADALRAALE